MSAEVVKPQPKNQVAYLPPPRELRRPTSPARAKYLFYRAWGWRLRYARHQLRITEQEAAAAFGVTIRTYRRHEAGKEHRNSSVRKFTRTYNVHEFGCSATRAYCHRGFGCGL